MGKGFPVTFEGNKGCPQIGLLGSGREAGPGDLAPPQAAAGPHVSLSRSPQRWGRHGPVGALDMLVGSEGPEEVMFTSGRESRTSAEKAARASSRNDVSAREKPAVIVLTSLGCLLPLLWWGNEMYLSFQTCRPGRAEGLCTVRVSQSNPNTPNHGVSSVQM